jgi:CubicO group peptidase (beta-lactamase class C family)
MTIHKMTLLLVPLLATVIRPAEGADECVFPSAAWELATPESQGVDSAKLQAAVDYLSEAGGKDGVKRMVIVRNGRMIWRGPEADKPQGVWSVTKAFTSTAHGLLIEDGKCSLDTLAKDFDPALAEFYPTVTLRHLATMTSGLDGVGGGYDYDDQRRGDQNALVEPLPPFFPPGTKYMYWDEATQHYGYTLTQIAGESLHDYLKRRILDPIGITQFTWKQDATGKVLNWTGGIEISAEDLARFGLLFLNRGNWNGRQLIDANWVDQATRVQVPPSIPNALPASTRKGSGIYGFHWWPNGVTPEGQRHWPDAPLSTYARSGYNNNDLFVIPAWNMVTVRLGLDEKEDKITAAEYNTFLRMLGEAILEPAVEGELLSVVAVAACDSASADQTANIAFRQSSTAVDAYDFVEVTIDVARPTAANPFTDAVVTGEFRCGDGQPVRVDGFCDSQDGRVFRIRFMPTKPGVHQYSVSYRQGDFEAKHAGSFTARDGGRRGLVRVDPEHPWHFLWEGTGEHYFWNGTTTYFLMGWDDQTIRQALDRLHRLKVNRVRVVIMGRVKDGQAWMENVYPTDKFTFLLNPWVAARPESLENPGFDVTRFNVAHWQKYDRLLRHARDLDMVVSVIFYVDGRRPGTDPFGKSGMGGPDEQRYYRYAVARCAAFSNIMWDVTNEYHLFRDEAWVNKMGGLIRQWDPYGHLASVHGHGEFPFRTSPWADFAMHQKWDEGGGYAFIRSCREKQEKTGRIMPQINEEYGYEDHYPRWGGNRKWPARTADNRRRLAWEMVMAGGYQTTGERADTGTGWGADTGGGWINGRGDDSMVMLQGYGHLVDFFTSIPWWTLNPDDELIGQPDPRPQRPNRLTSSIPGTSKGRPRCTSMGG